MLVDRLDGVWYYTGHEIYKCRYFAGGEGKHNSFPARSKTTLKFVIQSPMSKVQLSQPGLWTLDVGRSWLRGAMK